MQRKADKIIKKFNKKDQAYTLNQIEAKFNIPDKSTLVIDYWNELIADFQYKKNVGQADVFKDALYAFRNFDKKLDKLTFRDIDFTYINRFFEYCRYERNCKDTTISTYLRTIRVLLNKAIEIGIGSKASYPFSNRYPGSAGTKYFNINKELNHNTQPRHLPIRYLQKINNATFEDFWLIWTQKLFMFSFFTYGMNFIDMGHLRKSNIDEIANKIFYKRRKTGKQYNIAINKDIGNLLIFFREKMMLVDDFILPIVSTPKLKSDALYNHISNKGSKFNEFLKVIATELDIPAKITSYYSRHSYAMALKSKGVSMSIISEALGHETEGITKTYLDSFQNDEVAKASEDLL